jgi:hypothetical protein
MTDKSAGEALLELASKDIYEHWRFGANGKKWEPGGNSDKQEEARAYARVALAALRASPQPSESAAPVAAGSEDALTLIALRTFYDEPIDKPLNDIEEHALFVQMRKVVRAIARTAHPEPAAAEPVASRCPDCRGSGWLQEGVNAMVTRQIECHRCKGKGLIYTAPPSASAPSQPSELQAKVAPWMQECFGPVISADKLERSDRFIEESLELVQACGYERERAHALVEYVFNRPVGEPSQEVGGVMVTLAALCLAHGMDMHAAGETEVRRISAPDVIAKIRAKQASKPTGSALPISQLSEGPSRVTELLVEWGGTPNHNLTRRDAIEWCDRFAAALAAAEGKGNG